MYTGSSQESLCRSYISTSLRSKNEFMSMFVFLSCIGGRGMGPTGASWAPKYKICFQKSSNFHRLTAVPKGKTIRIEGLYFQKFGLGPWHPLNLKETVGNSSLFPQKGHLKLLTSYKSLMAAIKLSFETLFIPFGQFLTQTHSFIQQNILSKGNKCQWSQLMIPYCLTTNCDTWKICNSHLNSWA